MWLSAIDALARLGTKPQTLYANVSRGRIRAKPDPLDSRRSLYSSEDVERLSGRARSRSREAVAAEVMHWGSPVLASAISTISRGRLIYRGLDAAELSATASLEDVMGLLWGGLVRPAEGRLPVPAGEAMPGVFAVLAEMAATAMPSHGRGTPALRTDAVVVHGTIADALLGQGEEPLHERLARRFDRPKAADILRRGLVLLADHELNASTFAARVAVSTGASLAAGALAGLAAFSGPLHGQASTMVSALADDIGANPHAAEAGLREWLGEGRVVPGFGHRLYPDGDVRATALLDRVDLPPEYRALRRAGEALTGEAANVDFALAALRGAYGLPREAPMMLFTLARAAGWLAHMLEQAASGEVIRPRARYTGALPDA